MICCISVKLGDVLDDIQRELKLSAKELAWELRIRPDELSKVKSGARSLGVDHLLHASDAIQEMFRRAWRLRQTPEAPAQLPSADLLDDIQIKFQQLKARLGHSATREVA